MYYDRSNFSARYKPCCNLSASLLLANPHALSNPFSLNSILIGASFEGGLVTLEAVSYTHLDVYKRQRQEHEYGSSNWFTLITGWYRLPSPYDHRDCQYTQVEDNLQC